MSTQLHEEAEEGEAWLMSYADLVSLLLAVFVLLFSMSSVDSDKASAVNEAVAKYLQSKTVEDGAVADVTLADRQLQALRLLTTYLDLGHPDSVLERLVGMVDKPDELVKLKSLAEKMGVMGSATVARPTLRSDIVIPDSLLFEPGTVYLTMPGVRALERLAPALREMLKERNRTLLIEGHTSDGVLPKDSPFSSLHILSAARAEAVSMILVRQGIPAGRIQIVGKGASEPLFPEKIADGRIDPAAQARNRRVVLSVLTPRD